MQERLVAEIARAVAERLGDRHPELGSAVESEVRSVLAESRSEQASRVVVSAHGRNRSGIVAGLARVVEEFSGDIRDLSQTIVGEYFSMLFVVDLPHSGPESGRFAQFRGRLQEAGSELGCHVVVMHDDILSTMHTV